MHKEVADFMARVKQAFPAFFKGKKVLEVGSLNINGSVRDFFCGCDYVGIDLLPGPGVDAVVKAHEYVHPESFDVVVSTEALEHDEHWRKSLAQMYANLRPGGLLLVSCAGPTRLKHGVTDRKPEDSPATNHYYRNLSVEHFDSVFPLTYFSMYRYSYGRGGKDLFFYGLKNGPVDSHPDL